MHRHKVISFFNHNKKFPEVLSLSLSLSLSFHSSLFVFLLLSVFILTTTSCVAQLQDSGNLVLIQGNNKKVLWQSFDYPTDTLLPNMRLGLNRIIGLDRFLTSWKSEDDPGTGDYFYKMNPTGSPQVSLYKGSTLYWRSDPWPWKTSSSAAASVSSVFYNDFVNNKDEVSYAYFLDDLSIISRLVVDNSGLLQNLMWNDDDLQWKESWSARKYQCDYYGHCGPNSKCVLDSDDNSNKFECTCLPGYEPKSPKDWYLRDGSGECVRKQPGFSMCGNGEGFVKLTRLKGPDSSNAAWMDMSMSSSECEKACLSNCSCTAFTSMNIDGKGTRCLAWYGELMDISENTLEPWDLNVRVDATELGSLLFLLEFFINSHFCLFSPFGLWIQYSSVFFFPATYTRKSKGFLGPKGRRAVIIISVSVPLFLVSLIAYMWLMKRKKKGNKYTHRSN